MNQTQVSTLDPTTFIQLQEEERQRLARALMSGPGQILANTLMEIEYALPLLEKNPQAAMAGLTALRNELRDGLSQLKEYVAELQPPLLSEMGLGASIEQYVRKFGERTNIRAECRGCEKFEARYPSTIEITLFRVLQEALANVQSHSNATSVRVELTRGNTQVGLTIQDNGRGFVPRAENVVSKKRPLGLIAMRDRVELLGGQMQLFSEAGRGVRVVITIPYHGHVPEILSHGGQGTDERTNYQATRAGSTRNNGEHEKESKSSRKSSSAAKTRTTTKSRRKSSD